MRTQAIFRRGSLAALILVGTTLLACGGGGGSSGGSSGGSGGGTPPVNQIPIFSSSGSASLTENTTLRLYTVNVSDPENALASVTLMPSGDGALFALNPQSLGLYAIAKLDYENPQDADANNVYILTFEAADAAGNIATHELSVTVTDVPDSVPSALSPTLSPSENFELDDWKVQLPINADGEFAGGDSDQIEDYDLDDNCTRYLESGSQNGVENLSDAANYNGCENRYFYTGADGGIVMTAPPRGATTSENTVYTRTEFREMLRRGNRSISTNGDGNLPNGNNWAFSSAPQSSQDSAGGIDGTLRVTLAVNAVTTTSSSDRPDQVGRLVIGQIHAADDEPIRLYYRKLPQNQHGTIYAAHEISRNSTLSTAGDDVYYDIIGGRDNDQADLSNGIQLGEVFTYVIQVTGNIMDVTIEQSGTVIGSTQINMADSGYDIANDYHYFKAGVYHLNNTADDDEFAQVTIYELENTHN